MAAARPLCWAIVLLALALVVSSENAAVGGNVERVSFHHAGQEDAVAEAVEVRVRRNVGPGAAFRRLIALVKINCRA